MIEIRLPFPPSVNNLYFNVQRRGRVHTPEYLDWQELAGWELRAQRSRLALKIKYPVTVKIDLDDKRKGDADNRCKAVLDLLVEHQIIVDDSKKYVRRVDIGWEPVTGCRVEIMGAA